MSIGKNGQKNRDTLNEGVDSHDISNSIINSITPQKSDINTTINYFIQRKIDNILGTEKNTQVSK